VLKYDLIIRDCLVVDPLNKINKVTSIGLAKGEIVETGDDLDGKVARQVVGFPGAILMPGLIDTHMHCSEWLGGELAFGMLSRAGVTTALDMAGPTTSVLHAMKKRGSGINVATLEAVRPGVSVKDLNPSYDECASLLQKSLSEGAIGLKLTGGHYPLTPEATANAIKAATDGRSYMAFHAGSAKNGSNIEGFMDAVEFADGRPFHMAHINAYCRGMIMKDPKEEMQLAIRTLKDNRQIVSEFHPAPLNGTSGKCKDNQPESHVTRNCLRMGGYPETEGGLRQALKDGYAQVSWENLDGENRYVQGMKAFEYWENMKGICTCCFPVNDRESAFLCASAVDENGNFVIDALSSDGGGIPRNFMIRYGYQLVTWGLWTIEDYVRMTSLNPARMLGLENKGHLSPGADADITIFDPIERKPLLTLVKGKGVCSNGVLLAEGGTVICTEKGYDSVKSAGLNAQIVNLEKSMLYAGR
jgi:hypothetical protein